MRYICRAIGDQGSSERGSHASKVCLVTLIHSQISIINPLCEQERESIRGHFFWLEGLRNVCDKRLNGRLTGNFSVFQPPMPSPPQIVRTAWVARYWKQYTRV